MITKTFDYKGQMINYFNKVSRNKNIECVYCGRNEKGKLFVSYKYQN